MHTWRKIQMTQAARALQQTTLLWAHSSERSSEISRGIEYLSSSRRRNLLSRAFCVQRDAIRAKENQERQLSKMSDMKMLTRIVVMWRNDAAKTSIVTKRSLISSGGMLSGSASSQSKSSFSTELGSESRAAGISPAPAHSRRRASVHAYSHFMNSQLRQASLDLECSFADDMALTPAKLTGDAGLLRGPLVAQAFHAHESPVSRHVQTAVGAAMRSSDL
jgi:hypothetical protein